MCLEHFRVVMNESRPACIWWRLPLNSNKGGKKDIVCWLHKSICPPYWCVCKSLSDCNNVTALEAIRRVSANVEKWAVEEKKCCFVFHEMPAEDRKNKNLRVCVCVYVHLYVCGGGLFVFLMGCDSCWQEKNREGETSCCAGWTECEILHYRAKAHRFFLLWRKNTWMGDSKKKLWLLWLKAGFPSITM